MHIGLSLGCVLAFLAAGRKPLVTALQWQITVFCRLLAVKGAGEGPNLLFDNYLIVSYLQEVEWFIQDALLCHRRADMCIWHT